MIERPVIERPAIERQVIVPVGPDTLWEALTEPREVGTWFGHQVEWELVPGGRARWTQGDEEGTRLGVIDHVDPGRRLSFRWWPKSGDGPASAVTYDLEPSDDEAGGTRLTVREAPIPQPEDTPSCATVNSVAWTSWDSRQVGLWVRLHALERVTV